MWGTDEGKPAWVRAIMDKDDERVREHWARGAFALDAWWQGRPLSVDGFSGNVTPLGLAIGHQAQDVVRLMLQWGASPNEPCAQYSAASLSRFTPLGWAVYCRCNAKTLCMLISRGASVDAVSEHSGRQHTPAELENIYKRPDEALELCRRRERCHAAAVTLIGARKYRRSEVLRSNALDVVVMIAQFLCETRTSVAWHVEQPAQ